MAVSLTPVGVASAPPGPSTWPAHLSKDLTQVYVTVTCSLAFTQMPAASLPRTELRCPPSSCSTRYVPNMCAQKEQAMKAEPVTL